MADRARAAATIKISRRNVVLLIRKVPPGTDLRLGRNYRRTIFLAVKYCAVIAVTVRCDNEESDSTELRRRVEPIHFASRVMVEDGFLFPPPAAFPPLVPIWGMGDQRAVIQSGPQPQLKLRNFGLSLYLRRVVDSPTLPCRYRIVNTISLVHRRSRGR